MCLRAPSVAAPCRPAGARRPVIGFDGVRRCRYSQRRLRKYQIIPSAVSAMIATAT